VPPSEHQRKHLYTPHVKMVACLAIHGNNIPCQLRVYNRSSPEENNPTFLSTTERTSPIVVKAKGKQPTNILTQITCVPNKRIHNATHAHIRRHQPQCQLQLYPFTSERFHALLNSLFKVLFNFPSRYLFAIGLVLYVALDGVYHPIWSAFSSKPTLE
jgi:hypothetical protein